MVWWGVFYHNIEIVIHFARILQDPVVAVVNVVEIVVDAGDWIERNAAGDFVVVCDDDGDDDCVYDVYDDVYNDVDVPKYEWHDPKEALRPFVDIVGPVAGCKNDNNHVDPFDKIEIPEMFDMWDFVVILKLLQQFFVFSFDLNMYKNY